MILPDPRLEMPALLYPGRKPTGKVALADQYKNGDYCFVNEWGHGLGKADLLGMGGTGISVERDSLVTTIDASPYVAKEFVESQLHLTVVCRHQWTTLGVREGVFGHETAGSAKLNLQLGYGDSTMIFLYHGNTNFTTEFTPSSGAIQVGKIYTFVLVHDGTRADDDRAKLFMDGVDQSVSWQGLPGALTPVNIEQWSVGGGNLNSDSITELFYTERRSFSDAEALSVSSNPYQILIPA